MSISNTITRKNTETISPQVEIPLVTSTEKNHVASQFLEKGFSVFQKTNGELTEVKLNELDRHFNQDQQDLAIGLERGHCICDITSHSDSGAAARKMADAIEKSLDKDLIQETIQDGVRLHLACDDRPQWVNEDGSDYNKPIKGVIDDIEVHFFHTGPIVIGPSENENGFTQKWKGSGKLPSVRWSELQETFKLQSPKGKIAKTSKSQLEELQDDFAGDLKTLDLKGVFEELGLLGECLDSKEQKWAVKCPNFENHERAYKGWKPSDRGTFIKNPTAFRRPIFKCYDPHCTCKGLADVIRMLEDQSPGVIDRHCVRRKKTLIRLPQDRAMSELALDIAKAASETQQIFRRGNKVVFLNGNEFEELKPERAVTFLEEFISFYKFDSKGNRKPGSLSIANSKIVVNSPQLIENLPEVKRLLKVPLPIMKEEGALAMPNPGYDERFSTYLFADAPKIPIVSFEKAKEIIDDLLVDVLFKDDASRSAALCYIVGCFSKGLCHFSKGPVFVFRANQPRVGKDTLAGVAQLLTEGYSGVFPPLGKGKDEEVEKRITAALVAAKTFFHMANLKCKVNFPSLEAATDNSTRYAGRELGFTKLLELANEMTYSLSLNSGYGMSLDLTKRAMFVDLFYEGENPDCREFKHPSFTKYVLENREQILGAIFALMRNWYIAGCPKPPKGHGSFPEWSRTVVGIVWAAGYGDPCELRRPEEVEPDYDTENMRNLFAAIYDEYEDAEIGKEELYRLIDENELFPYSELQHEGDGRVPREIKNERTSFGKKLKERFCGRVLSGLKLQVVGSVSRPKYRITVSDDREYQRCQRIRLGLEDEELNKNMKSLETVLINHNMSNGIQSGVITDEGKTIRIVRDSSSQEQLLSSLKDSDKVYLNVTTQNITLDQTCEFRERDVNKAEVIGINLSFEKGIEWRLDVQGLAASNLLSPVLEMLRSKEIVGHDMLPILKLLVMKYEFCPSSIFCIKTAFEVMYKTKEHQNWTFERCWQIVFQDNPGDEIDLTHLRTLEEATRNKLGDCEDAVSRDLIGLIASVEKFRNGIPVDLNQLRTTVNELEDQRRKLLLKQRASSSDAESLERQIEKVNKRLGALRDIRKRLWRDGRIRPNFHPQGASTSRFTCRHPNAQGIPRDIRNVLAAPEGFKFVRADYSQIDLRVLANESEDLTMIECFVEGTDFHTLVGETITGKSDTDDESVRDLGKQFNNAMVYGAGEERLHEIITEAGFEVELEEVKSFIGKFNAKFQGLYEYKENILGSHKHCPETSIYTRTGRRLFLEEGTGFGRAYRNLLNLPIQSIGADGLKESLGLLLADLPKGIQLVTTVHDEIVLLCPDHCVSEAKDLLKESMIAGMEKFVSRVPIEVDVEEVQSLQKS